MSSKRRGSNRLLVFGLIALLLIVIIFILQQKTTDLQNTYQYEASITPVPSPTLRPIVTQQAIVTYSPAPTKYSAPTATPSVLRTGSRGEMVLQMQTRLAELGYYDGELDGQFGTGTKAAVQSFQRQNGLTTDGEAGTKTLTALYADTAIAYEVPVLPQGNNDFLILVNRKNSLPKDYTPSNLVKVKDIVGNRMTYANEDALAVREAAEALAVMLDAAIADGIQPWKLRESYRTYEQQKRIFDSNVQSLLDSNRYSSRADAIVHTRLTVADPGQSEHHTGLAFDLNVEGRTFGDTAQYAWLARHCWEYGFIMRYTDENEDITGFLGEEWHIRYVGVEHSMKMKELGYCLEEYLEAVKAQ